MNINYLTKPWKAIKINGFIKLFYLTATEEPTNSQRMVLFLIFALWFVIVVTTVMHHEYWRDEIRALSLALDSGSWMQLSSHIKNEGHPILWYAVIKASLSIFGKTLTLPILSVGIAACAVFIFLFKSPFPIFLKVLFTFSILPAYEYSVMSRNYGISMLVMFTYASLYKNRKHNLFYLCILLALLANTNLPSLMAAGLLTILLIWDTAIEDPDNRGSKVALFFGLLGLILIAGFFSLLTIKPDDRSLLTTANHVKPISEYWISVRAAFLNLESNLTHFFPEGPGLFQRLLPQLFMWLSIIGLKNQKRLALCLFFYFLSFGFLQHYAYPMALRHEGIGFIFIITLYWISCSDPKENNEFKLDMRWIFIYILMPVILVWGNVKAYKAIMRDINHPVSSSKDLGQFLSNKPEYKGATLIGEPDYLFEAVPYYADISLYIPRESLFRNYGRSTDEQMQLITLDDILVMATKLKQKNNKPVLIAFPWDEKTFQNENRKDLPYYRIFIWSNSDWLKFKDRTIQLGTFNRSISEENFYLYQLK